MIRPSDPPPTGPSLPPAMGDGAAAYVAAFLAQTHDQLLTLETLAAAVDPEGRLGARVERLAGRIETFEVRLALVPEGGGSLDRLLGKITGLVDRMDLMVARHAAEPAADHGPPDLARLVTEA